LFEQAGYSRDSTESRNPKVQLFFYVSKINSAASFGSILFDLHRVFQRPVDLNKAGYSSDQNQSINPKIKLFSAR